MKLISIQVGKPQALEAPGGKTWSTGFFKQPVDGPVYAGKTGLDGDGQADLKVHGGPDKAINVYPHEHYAYWQKELGTTLSPAAFGENFTTQGLLETDVCIGDIFKAGSLLLQISQPRQPCWKLARRWDVPELPKYVVQTGYTGWYFRVLEKGEVQAPCPLDLVERPFPEWTVAEAMRVRTSPGKNPDAARALGRCPALAVSWQVALG